MNITQKALIAVLLFLCNCVVIEISQHQYSAALAESSEDTPRHRGSGRREIKRYFKSYISHIDRRMGNTSRLHGFLPFDKKYN